MRKYRGLGAARYPTMHFTSAPDSSDGGVVGELMLALAEVNECYD